MPEAAINPKGIGDLIMKQPDLFNSVIAEVKLSYSHSIRVSDMIQITGSKDAYNAVWPNWEDIQYIEKFYVMYLNRGNRVLGLKLISQGGVSGTVVDVRIILQGALLANASAMILMHNHPSGQMQPSDADLKITRKIKDAAVLLDISVLDHLIVSAENYLSMADEGLL